MNQQTMGLSKLAPRAAAVSPRTLQGFDIEQVRLSTERELARRLESLPRLSEAAGKTAPGPLLDRLDFMGPLCALVPPPRSHMIRQSRVPGGLRAARGTRR